MRRWLSTRIWFTDAPVAGVLGLQPYGYLHLKASLAQSIEAPPFSKLDRFRECLGRLAGRSFLETSGQRHVVNSSMLIQLGIVTVEFMVSVGGWARNPTMAKLLYAGPTKSITSGSTNIATVQSSKAVSSLGDVVQISDAAKAALKEMQATKTEVTPTLKSKVEKLFQEARDRGSMISFDSSKGGEWMDMSSFTDDELAKIRLDKGAEFPQDLSDYAEGALGQRLRVSLEPYEGLVNNGDRRAHVMTIQKLYEQMSPDVRAALNWTPAMMADGQHMLDGDNRQFGPFNMDTVESNLIDAAKRGGLSYSAARTID